MQTRDPGYLGQSNRGPASAGHRFTLHRVRDTLAIVFALLVLFALMASAQTPARTAETPAKIEVTVRPIAAFEPRDPARVQFGPLTYRGGMSLTSSYPEFGGISSIRLNADGARFLAVTDKGWWLRGRI